ncbi:hypothetical protein QQG91_11405 [Marivivens sp. LCG002]|uniref:hypothetical protein n=1 Tax=Marivivens sp. LCG002 TaxID=3051171 RepID=UPI0025528DF6|nr:hypothetical protein [Marivivens sp. LCG002]WIV50272.1 hypothetical protein QQG91_11405 [Marivivens sp. LCG002]
MSFKDFLPQFGHHSFNNAVALQGFFLIEFHLVLVRLRATGGGIGPSWLFMERLSLFEERLSEHFIALSLERGEESVFLIEHGLEVSEISELIRAVGARGGAVGFRSETWRPYRLSLGVALTEFGYQYRGTGTEFWGFAERGLGAEISIAQRPEITAVFKLLSRDYKIANPLNDRWSQAFGHVAWPIRNALVSREIHSPLARLVRDSLRASSSAVFNAAFVATLREVATGLTSKRLEAWLTDESLAVSVVRALADGTARGLRVEPKFMERLEQDLRGNREVRRLTLAARAARQAQNTAPRRLPRPLYQLLMRDDEPVGLAVRGPSLDAEQFAYLDVLTGGEWRDAILSVAGRSMPFREFLAGGLIFIGRPRELPTPDLSGIEVNDTIASLVLPSENLLFVDVESDGYQTQILSGSRLPDDAGFFELRLGNADPENWGAALFGMRANSSEGAAKLLANGILIAQKELVEFFGGATFVQSDEEMYQVEGHDVWVKALVGSVNLEVKSNSGDILSTRALPIGYWVRLETDEEPCSLHISDGHSKQISKLAFRPSNSVEPLRIEVSPEQITLNDIGVGLGSLDVKSPSKLDGASMHVALMDSQGNRVSSEFYIETLPSVVGFSIEAMSPIREAALRWSSSGKSATIVANVEGLVSMARSMSARHLDWVFDESQRTWTSDNGQSVRSISFDLSSNPISPHSKDEIKDAPAELLLPDVEGDEALTMGRFFINSEHISLTDIGATSSLSIRKNRSSVGDSNGLIAASEALVAWQSGSATSLVADGMRRRVGASIEAGIVEALCGNDWNSIEKKLDLSNSGFHGSLVRFSLERKLAAGNDNFDELSQDQLSVLAELLFVEFRKVLPTVSVVLIPDGDEWPELDNAVNEAWTRLASQLEEANGITVDGDCIVFDGQWQKAVKDAREADLMRPLARKVLPITRSIGLLQLPYLEVGFDDLISELNSRHLDVQRTGRHIPPEALRTLLSLFLQPSQTIENPDWRNLLARFASDRFTARAVRYAALRYRAVR